MAGPLVETLLHPTLGPRVRERLRTLLVVVHSRGRMHITHRLEIEENQRIAASFFLQRLYQDMFSRADLVVLR